MTNEDTKLEALSNGIFALIYLFSTTQTDPKIVVKISTLAVMAALQQFWEEYTQSSGNGKSKEELKAIMLEVINKF